MNPEIRRIIEDAEGLAGKAIEEAEVNIRDAAEKAWGAVVKATNALILRFKPEVYDRAVKVASVRRSALMEICEDPKIAPLRLWERYGSRETYLHGQCFYEGICEPIGPMKRRIIETMDYVRDVKEILTSF